MADHRLSKRPEQSTSTSSQPLKSSAPCVRLSCEMCRQRKVKCDKLTPCTNCQRLRAVCVPVERARLPRGRTRRSAAVDRRAEPDPDLRDRVSRVEQLLQSLIHGGKCGDGTGSVSEQGGSLGRDAVSCRVRDQESVSELIQQTQGLQNAMSSRSDSRQQQQQQQQSLNADFVSYGMAPVGLISPQNLPCIRGGSSGASPPATSHIREQLCEIFMGQVDPVFKILHGPSLREFLVDGKPYLDYEPGHSAPAALASAVYYAAICSLSNEQCAVLFGNSKKVVVANYQREAEAALLNADVTTTNDLTVLLAYVLFLVSARSQGQSRRVWTMLSMALRVSQALSLHVPDPPFPVRPLEREMRRRLFQAVGFLDVQASLDHASEPMMQTGWLQSHPPSNINDSDIRFDMEGPVHDSDDFTDTTFTLMISKAQYVLRLLNVSGFTEPGVKYMHMRQQLVRDFQQTASNLLRKCQPDVNFHWFIKKTAECINASLQLIALRPLQQNANFTPPRVNEAGLLKLAVDVLQKTQELSTDPRGRAWSWFEGIFAPWHALAVAVAELCVCEDPSLMERYWPTVEEGYNRFSSVVTDSQQMTLWGPMEKIITRARARRDELLDTFAPAADTSNNQTTATSLFRATDSPSQGSPSLSGNDWQTQSPSFPHVASQEDDGAQNQISPTNMALSSPSNWLAPWPNLWDAIDFSYTGIESVCDTAWLNYETFIQDIYGSNESMSMLR